MADDADALPGDQPEDLVRSRAALPNDLRIRAADTGDRLDVVRVLDGAMLQTRGIPERLRNHDVLVAVAARGSADEDRSGAVASSEAVVGAAVLETREEDRHLDAVAVRRARRGRGIGSALVARAVRDARESADSSRFTAEFDADLREFYAELGFEIEPVGATDEDSDADSARLRGTILL